MKDKTQFLTLSDAAALVTDGQRLALGGMALNRRPVAFVQELLRREQRPKDLSLLAFTAGYAADLLVGARCVTEVQSVYFGLESFGLAPMFTRLAGRGDVHVREETETSLVLGLRAQVSGVGYLPSVAWQGTSLLHLREDVTSVTDPYTGDTLTAFPAIPVDVAVIHGLEADQQGNVAINNNLAVDQLLVYAAETVIVTVEQVVDAVVPSVDRTIIPAAAIDVICEASGGAQPTSCYPLYPIRGRVFAEYIERCTDEAGFAAYLAEILA